MDEEAAESALEAVTKAIQKFVNEIDDEAPILLRGGVIVWETMKSTEDSQIAFKVGYASLPNTSMAETIGTLSLAKEYALRDMMGEEDE